MSNKKIFTNKPKSLMYHLPEQGMEKDDFIDDFRQYYVHLLGRDEYSSSPLYAGEALSMTIRDRLVERWKATLHTYRENDSRQTFYLSMEYLMGRALSNAMLNLGVTDTVMAAMYDLGIKLEELIACEPDAGLGNGGLGRLAACIIDSCATLQLPVTGYGLRYEYGMFTQAIINGEQVEKPDHWLRHGNVWEVERLDISYRVKFGGRVEEHLDEHGKQRFSWIGTNDVLATPYDMPIPGYKNGTVNTLRLWKALATEEFDLEDFNAGDYAEAVAAKIAAENITMVLYPNDHSENGKELRLRQQYFLASASLQDVLANWLERHGTDFSNFAEKNCFQINETHPSIIMPELMRLLMDIHGLSWNEAWKITRSTMAYTNHTLLPEALEKWSVPLMQRLLPRLMDIIFSINARLMTEVAMRWPGNGEYLRRMSIIEEGHVQMVRMSHLAIAGSFSVNGVAKLHSQLLQQGLFKDFYDLTPKKFNNKTNGVTPRRWLAGCNPELAALITATIGDAWLTDLTHLKKLQPFADNAQFRQRWRDIRHVAKQRLLDYKKMQFNDVNVTLTTNALFDVQVKRIHEYKRQLLNVLHVIHLYDRIKRGDGKHCVARCVLIGGKAASGYAMAKKIIKFINNVAHVVNEDPDTDSKLCLLFFPDYRVSALERICPATDLSEQISVAGKEASGTGNMKLMMNGAITIGTLDGANIEIREEVGDDNFFLFGLTAEQIVARREHYDPLSIIASDDDLQRVMQLIESNLFNQFEPHIFDDLINAMKSPHDPWMTIADFRSYIDAQRRVEDAYRDQEHWTHMSIINCANSGKFSTDRTVHEYNQDIWKLDPQPIKR